MQRALQWACLILIAALASGCVRVRVVQRDPGITAEDLRSGRIGIAAVTASGGGEYIVADRISEVLIRHLSESGLGLSIVPLERTKELFPAGDYARFVSRFTETGAVQPEDFETLRHASSECRFVLLVDLRETDAKVFQSRSSTTHYSSRKDVNTGQWIQEVDSTEYKTSNIARRTVSAVFLICDLRAGGVVWTATSTLRLAATRSESSTSWYPRNTSWPGLPSFVEAVESMARRLVKKLPT